MRQNVYSAIALFMISTLLLAGTGTPAAANSPWVHDDWQYRIPFDADDTKIEGDEEFEDFSMLVTLDGITHADVFAFAKVDGSDLLVVSDLGLR